MKTRACQAIATVIRECPGPCPVDFRQCIAVVVVAVGRWCRHRTGRRLVRQAIIAVLDVRAASTVGVINAPAVADCIVAVGRCSGFISD